MWAVLNFPLQVWSFSHPPVGGEVGGATGLAIGLEVTGVATGLLVAGGDPQLESQAARQASLALTPSLLSQEHRRSGLAAT